MLLKVHLNLILKYLAVPHYKVILKIIYEVVKYRTPFNFYMKALYPTGSLVKVLYLIPPLNQAGTNY